MGLWTPAELPPALWLDADDAATLTESGGAVSAWADKSGNGRDFAQGSSGSQPALVGGGLGGRSVVRFDGLNDYLAGNAACLDVARNVGAISIFAVAVNSGGDASRMVFEADVNVNNTFRAALRYSPTEVGGAGRRLDSDSFQLLWVTSSANLISAIYDYSGAELYVGTNGVYTARGGFQTPGNTSDTNSARVWLGATTESINRLAGDLAEIIVTQSVLPEAERQKVEGYLAHKWGLAGDLPAGHPYETNPPALPVTGTSAVTVGDDTVTAIGYVPVIGTGAVTSSDDSATATGFLAIVGISAATNADDVVTATGSFPALGTGAVTNADDTPAATGYAYPTGTASATNADDTAAGSGTALALISAVYGDWVTYICTLEGSPAITIPMSSFQARRRSGEQTALTVVTPSASQAADIAERAGNDLVITMTAHYHDGTTASAELARAALQSPDTDQGGRSQSMTLTARATVSNDTPKVVRVSGVSYRATNTGARRLRCAVNYSLTPGDTVEDQTGDRWVAGEIVYAIAPTSSTMEVKEA